MAFFAAPFFASPFFNTGTAQPAEPVFDIIAHLAAQPEVIAVLPAQPEIIFTVTRTIR